MVLHAAGSQNGPDGPRCPPLLSNHLSRVLGRNAQSQDRTGVFVNNIEIHILRSIDQSFCDLKDKGLHFFCFFCHPHTPPPGPEP